MRKLTTADWMNTEVDNDVPRIVNFQASVRPEIIEPLMELFTRWTLQGVKKVHMHISSPGGSVRSGLNFHAFLRSLPLELSTHNSGSVDSIANVIYLAGKHRTALPNATFLFHGVQSSYKGPVDFTESDLRASLKRILQDHASIAHVIASQSKMTVLEIKRAFRMERILSAEDAKKREIVHAIQDLPMPEGAPIYNIFNNTNGDE